MTRSIALWVLALVLVSCAGFSYKLIESGKRVTMAFYSFDPQIAWAGYKGRTWAVWTVDGHALHMLRFCNGLAEGKSLFDSEEGASVFRKDMTAHEVTEFVASSYAAEGSKQVKTARLKPCAFGTLEGFRFEMEYLDDQDLEKQAIVVGVVRQDKLYLVLYDAAQEYYFDKYRDPVERLIASIELVR